MARHAQPLEVAKLKGADKKNPQRYRATPPKSKLPLGRAPADLIEGADACWYELSDMSVPGVLTGADRIALEVLANMLCEYRAAPKDFATTKLGQMIGILGRFGMTPSDRTKLGVEDKKQDNPFARLDD